MEKYWKVFLVIDEDITFTNTFIIEREESYLIFDEVQKNISVLNKEHLPKNFFVIKSTKEKTLKALKNTFNSLELPKELNYIKHKF